MEHIKPGIDLKWEIISKGILLRTYHTKVFVIMIKKTLSKTNKTKKCTCSKEPKQNKTKINNLLTIFKNESVNQKKKI